jgi:hypothetical protein
MSQQFPDAIDSSINRISLADPRLVQSWCSELQCTEHELRAAVYAVGSKPEQIRSYFHRNNETATMAR